MPGFILAEAMAELLGTAAASGETDLHDRVGVLRRANLVFRQAVRPEDEVLLMAEITALRRGLGEGNVKALLGERVAAEGTISFGLIERSKFADLLRR